ncbi:hypothetical protein KIW84_058200 [Lathyrus oleraceus]|uniref:Cullin N-terminal domain-containing protein n=1 Tax=Pisum sativum TaxID=3888 RepID=A0A9D4X598_PEA|nr:hypothetical protein KIW84_058200 [Pisum sativum]
MSKFISFEEGWETLHKGITKLHKSLEGLEPSFTSEEFINLYMYLSIPQNNNDMFFFLDVYIFKNLTMYEMCTQKPQPRQSRNFARELYDKYRETCEEYIISNVYEKMNKEIMDAIFSVVSSIHYVQKVNSKMLTIIVEYCKKHGNYYELNGSYNELMEADAKFVEVDPQTLLDLTTSACYMKIESLEKLTSSKVDELIKGKTPEEIAQIFGDDSNSKLFEKLHEENVQRVKALEF